MTTPQEPWASAMINARHVDPRYEGKDEPSISRLAEAADLHPTTVSKMIRGVGVAKAENVAAVAAALGVDVVTVSTWVKQARTETKPYETPAEVNLLTLREQEALTEMILAIASTRKGRDGSAKRAASTSRVTVSDGSRVTRKTSADRSRQQQGRPQPNG